MAQVILYGRGEVTERLPDVCVCCGRPADGVNIKRFYWAPHQISWLLLFAFIPYFLARSLTEKELWAELPVCKEHRYPWRRGFMVRVLLILYILSGVLGPALFMEIIGLARTEAIWKPLGICYLAGLVGVLIVENVVYHRSLRPLEITSETMTLTNVSEEFVRQLEQMDQDEWEHIPSIDVRETRRGSTGITGTRTRRRKRDTEV